MTQTSKLPGEPHFNIPLSAKLFRLVTLKDGWDSYDGKPPTKEALKAIESIQVVPNSDGGVQFEFVIDGETHELKFGPDGNMSLWRTTTHRI